VIAHGQEVAQFSLVGVAACVQRTPGIRDDEEHSAIEECLDHESLVPGPGPATNPAFAFSHSPLEVEEVGSGAGGRMTLEIVLDVGFSP
jgi:hypothetical protein